MPNVGWNPKGMEKRGAGEKAPDLVEAVVKVGAGINFQEQLLKVKGAGTGIGGPGSGGGGAVGTNVAITPKPTEEEA